MNLDRQLDAFHRFLTGLWAEDGKRPGELTYSEYEYLRAIQRLDGARIEGIEAHENYRQGHHLQSIVAVLGVKKASASAAIARLEARDLIERFPCQIDSRAQHVRLTPAGEKILQNEFDAVYRAAADHLTTTLTPDELAVLTSAFLKLNAKNTTGDVS